MLIKNNEKSNNVNNIISENITKEVKEDKSSLSLVMIGDNLIHSSVYNVANKHANYNGYDFKPIIEYIKPIVQTYDLAYYWRTCIMLCHYHSIYISREYCSMSIIWHCIHIFQCKLLVENVLEENLVFESNDLKFGFYF